MLSTCVRTLKDRWRDAPPGRVGGRKEFRSRAIPGPGPSQNSAPCGSPPTRCSTAGRRQVAGGSDTPWMLVLCERPAASGTPALDKEVVHVRCAPVGNFLVVAPVLGRSAIKSQQSRRRASSLLLSPLQGTASPCYTWPLFLHTSAGVNPSGCSTPWSRAYRYPFIDI